jgi:hypothetical protein
MTSYSRSVFACIIATLTLAAVIPAQAALHRSLWVWSTKGIRELPLAQSQFFRFLAAPHGNPAHAITVIYFDGMQTSDYGNAKTVANLQQFLVAAHHRHIRVQFLCGDSDWATPAGLPQGVSYLKTILAFNSHSPPNARYDGFQYDVEPYTLPGWPSAALENGTVALFDASDAAIRASGQHLTLSAAIPRWFGQPQFGFLDRKIIDRTDEVIVMDYVTTPQQLINDPSDILHYANEKHKGVWIGVETGDLPDTPKSTFHQLGNGAMEEELKTDMPLFQAQPSFRGYAIHHYGSYAALKP